MSDGLERASCIHGGRVESVSTGPAQGVQHPRGVLRYVALDPPREGLDEGLAVGLEHRLGTLHRPARELGFYARVPGEGGEGPPEMDLQDLRVRGSLTELAHRERVGAVASIAGGRPHQVVELGLHVARFIGHAAPEERRLGRQRVAQRRETSGGRVVVPPVELDHRDPVQRGWFFGRGAQQLLQGHCGVVPSPHVEVGDAEAKEALRLGCVAEVVASRERCGALRDNGSGGWCRGLGGRTAGEEESEREEGDSHCDLVPVARQMVPPCSGLLGSSRRS